MSTTWHKLLHLSRVSLSVSINDIICSVTYHSLHTPIPTNKYREEETEHNVGRFVWPTAVLMLKHIISSNICLDVSLIIELGAGCGVLGMGLAHALSVSSQDVPIILTDHDEEWLQRNVTLNKTEIGQLPIEVTRLDWRNRNDIKVVQHMIQQRLSLVSDNKSEQQLMIVASDVLYNHYTHEALVYTLYQLSQVRSKHSTRIIIGFLDDRGGDEASFSTHARQLFGDAFKPSKPIVVDTRNGRKKELRVIDFTI